jgi:hypothetical protein
MATIFGKQRATLSLAFYGQHESFSVSPIEEATSHVCLPTTQKARIISASYEEGT